ncbi:hypothetical protein RGU70_01570 [Herbaspirillum sp. RTI4]|uniref:hypothetical protein n=1 Tax=Herbaspirillum sp. RTI4 TaxID=3048640 RepID=UPI002AB3E315|nr:hypothetical protein [Herbaspirillum sp. RTI4]MDY7577014.1 hypothetical protein [Herbaspirillum sp. RTI4]MEA9983085.1 hypothetical protein [Herbaspirillum sp. RTI4]
MTDSSHREYSAPLHSSRLEPPAKIDWQAMPFAERKRRLLVEGALLRLEMVDARMVIRENLNPGAIAKSALSRLVGAAGSLIGGAASGGPSGRLSPVLTTLLTAALTSKLMRKPLLYAGVLSVVGGVVYLLRKKRPIEEDEDMSSDYQ